MTAPSWVPLGPRSCGCRSWTSCAPGAAGSPRRRRRGARSRSHRGRRRAGCPAAGSAVSTGANARTGSWRHDDTLARRAHSGTAGPCSSGIMIAGGEVAAEEQLVLAAQQVVLAVPPRGLGVGAAAGPVRRGPGEGFQVGPVHRQRAAGVLELLRDAGFEQVIADVLQHACGQPVRLVLGQGIGDQAEGPLGLPVSQQVRAVVPVREHAQPPLVILTEGGQCLVHAGQVGGPVIGLGQAHAGQQGADRQLPGAHADGEHGLDARPRRRRRR